MGEVITAQNFKPATAGDLSVDDWVLVIYSGDVESGEPVDAVSVTVNQPEGLAGGFEGGGFGGRGGFGGIGFLNGTVGAVNGNLLTVATDSGETRVSQPEGLAGGLEAGATSDLTSGDRVLGIVSGDVGSGQPGFAVSVIVNPPEASAIFGGDSFGGRRRGQ